MRKFDIEERGELTSTEVFLRESIDARTNVEGHKLLFRGLSKDSYELKSSIGRNDHKYAGKSDICLIDKERQLLQRFRRRAYPFVGRALKAGEAIFIARHHGLPTRLLDWTGNALCALYFACEANPEDNALIWALARWEGEDSDFDAFDFANRETEHELFCDPFASARKVIKIIYPFFNSPRLVAQEGVFTVQSVPSRTIDSYVGEPFDAKELDIKRLIRWRIPRDRKQPMLQELSGLGISRRTFFPDLDGVAQSLWQAEVLWSEKKGGPIVSTEAAPR
jgi:hypothetical protein